MYKGVPGFTKHDSDIQSHVSVPEQQYGQGTFWETQVLQSWATFENEVSNEILSKNVFHLVRSKKGNI